MRGGKRPGAGRKLGSVTKKTRDIAVKAAASGETPLEYMLRVMRDKNAASARRDDMAKSAAPYMHSRFSTIEHTGKDGGPVEFTWKAPQSE